MTVVTYPHIDVRADGTPMIAGTPYKVIMIVLDRLAHHWDADEIRRQHPDLTLAQVYAALTFYYDNKEEMDRAIQERLQSEEHLLAQLPPSLFRVKLKTMGNAQ